MTPTHPLAGQHSVAEFRAATSTDTATATNPNPNPGSTQVAGFVFVETDRRNDAGQDWTAPLAEIAWMRRLATGAAVRAGEGHAPEDAPLCLGLVPWAPVASGPEELGRYLEKAEAEAGPEAWARVKGFRYLLQDKENGTALKEGFVEGLKVLGRKGFVFDVGVDQHRRGRVQLEEVVEVIDRAHEGVEEEEKVVFILSEFLLALWWVGVRTDDCLADHLCKPDLTILNQTDPSFIAWYVHAS
jgi:L-rhamnono-1,4-lactonase